MRKIKSVSRIKDPYVGRILSNIIGKDAFKVYAQTRRHCIASATAVENQAFLVFSSFDNNFMNMYISHKPWLHTKGSSHGR